MFDTTKQGAVDVIRGTAPIDKDSVESLEPVTAGVLAAGMPQLVLDLSGIPLLDSRGLEWILDLHEHCLALGGHLRVAAPTPLCRDIFDVTGLSEELDIFADTAAAVGSFAH